MAEWNFRFNFAGPEFHAAENWGENIAEMLNLFHLLNLQNEEREHLHVFQFNIGGNDNHNSRHRHRHEPKLCHGTKLLS